MKNNISPIIIIGIILVIIITSGTVKKEAGEATTRIFAGPNMSANQANTVSINVNPGTSTYYVVHEIVPAGWTITSASDSGDYTTNPGDIFWIVLTSSGVHTYTYTVNPGTNLGTYTLTGTAGFENQPEGAIGGATSIEVVQPASCTPVNGDWSAWSTCSASCTQNRTCTNPAPYCGGTTCSGLSTQSCVGGSCPTSCTDSTWIPTTTTVCSGTSFTQTSNCNNTRTSTGTQSCQGIGTTTTIYTPPSTTSTTPNITTTSTPTTTCQFYETSANGTCGISSWVWIVLVFSIIGVLAYKIK